MAGTRKTHGKFQGIFYIPTHTTNSYKQRVPDPQLRSLTKSDIERVIIRSLRGINLESLCSLPMLDDAYVYGTYFPLKRGPIGPYYLLLQRSSIHEPDKIAVVGLWTEEIYRSRLPEVA